jgi:hypothetical protein
MGGADRPPPHVGRAYSGHGDDLGRGALTIGQVRLADLLADGRQERAMTSNTKVWCVRALEYRRMAEISVEAERERKLLALAAKAEEQAEAVEQEAERSRD